MVHIYKVVTGDIRTTYSTLTDHKILKHTRPPCKFTHVIYPRHRTIVPYRQRTIPHTVFFPYHIANNTIPQTYGVKACNISTTPYHRTILPTYHTTYCVFPYHTAYNTIPHTVFFPYAIPTYPIYPVPCFFHIVLVPSYQVPYTNNIRYHIKSTRRAYIHAEGAR